MKVRRGDAIRIRDLVTVDDAAIPVPDPTRLTHHQFRRFASCPSAPYICSRWPPATAKITAAGAHDVVLSHFTPRELFTCAGDHPLDVWTTGISSSINVSAWRPRCVACSTRARRRGC